MIHTDSFLHRQCVYLSWSAFLFSVVVVTTVLLVDAATTTDDSSSSSSSSSSSVEYGVDVVSKQYDKRILIFPLRLIFLSSPFFILLNLLSRFQCTTPVFL